ncbi:hypothetical protein, partial [Actinomadura sp. 3N407]|uniref:hypothetical protein n=1 Tax=Actinomadura sp. 3N407 TaxID=3457423 RepID=UPI003FCE13B9
MLKSIGADADRTMGRDGTAIVTAAGMRGCSMEIACGATPWLSSPTSDNVRSASACPNPRSLHEL